jgi:tetratricopeptide (TPR) repeat protein
MLRSLKMIAALSFASVGAGIAAHPVQQPSGSASTPPIPSEIFRPSNARTESGGLIAEDQFFPASRCAGCHKDTHTAWSQSLHRNAAREPFYRESADILLRTRGIEFTRHCESCHSPVALFSGVLTSKGPRQEAPFTDLDDEGVTCSVCHSITEARLDGTGSYTIRRPALLEAEDGTPFYGDVTDAQIMADISGHKRAVMRPLLRTPEFCATCHKGEAPADLNGYKSLRGFSAYDEWQQSGASHETVAPFYRRPQRTDCRSCHMPKIPSTNDIAAKNGTIASHRWLGANTAAPLFYDQTDQARQIELFLKDNVLGVDVFALRRLSTGELIGPLSADGSNLIDFSPGEEFGVEVIVSNRNAAHSFPPELRDLYEPWIEFEVLDSSQKKVFHSGFLKPDGTLDEAAHVYKAVLLDESAQPITRHEVWLSKIKAYDNAIPAGRSDVVRYRFRLPDLLSAEAPETLTLRGRVNYRRFIAEYADFVLKRQKRRLSIPVVEMARTEVSITLHKSNNAGIAHAVCSVRPSPSQARRWNDYGIGLLEQAQYGPAAEAFRKASEGDPLNVDFLVSAALAEMKTERFSPERTQWAKAKALLRRALSISPTSPRARYYHALLLRGQGKLVEASEELARLGSEFPRDREVHRQLGQALFTLGRLEDARDAFNAILGIDPTDAGAYQFLSPIYLSTGMQAKADWAQKLYLNWRDDPLSQSVASRFFANQPVWSEERTAMHIHSFESPQRAVVADTLIAPQK